VTQPEDNPVIQQLREYGLATPVAHQIAQLGETLRARTQESGTEFAVMVDADSGVRIGDILGGGTNQIDISAHTGAMRPGRRYIHLHTHPRSSSFSDTDLGTMVTNRQIHTMVVVGADSTWYLVARTATTPPVLPSALYQVWQEAARALHPQYNLIVTRGTMTPGAAVREYSHVILEIVASQFDFRYTRVETRRRR